MLKLFYPLRYTRVVLVELLHDNYVFYNFPQHFEFLTNYSFVEKFVFEYVLSRFDIYESIATAYTTFGFSALLGCMK